MWSIGTVTLYWWTRSLNEGPEWIECSIPRTMKCFRSYLPWIPDYVLGTFSLNSFGTRAHLRHENRTGCAAKSMPTHPYWTESAVLRGAPGSARNLRSVGVSRRWCPPSRRRASSCTTTSQLNLGASRRRLLRLRHDCPTLRTLAVTLESL